MAKDRSEEKRSLEVAEAARETAWTRPSFVGELFMGRFQADLIFPYPEQSPADKAAGDEVLVKVETFLKEKLDADEVDATRTIPDDVMQGLKELGLFGIKIPTEYDGLGMSQINYNRIIQLVASHCASTAVLLSAHQSIGVPQPLKMFGTDEQKQKYLPLLAKGAVSAFSLTEEGVGSDPSKMSTTAVLDGDEWVINGRKLWTTNGPIADIMIVMARTNAVDEKVPEISAFIVETPTDGLTTDHRCDFLGLKAIQNGLLTFDNVRIPKENILGEAGRGLAIALKTLNTGRLTLPAAGGGAMKQALAMSRDWANERAQWGAPIGHHEAVANKIANLAAETYAVEAVTWLTSAMADEGDLDIRLEAAMAKLFCSEAMWRATDTAVQIRGGRGYETGPSLGGRGEKPMPAERLLRDARINLIIEGTSEIMRLFIAREALDPHLKAAGMKATGGGPNILKAGKFYAGWYPRTWLPNVSLPEGVEVHGKLRGHLRFVQRRGRQLARDLFHMMMRYQAGLQRKQYILGRLVDAGAELFAMTATIARASSTQADAGAVKLADLFCRQARRRLKDLHRDVYCNDDKRSYKLAREILEGKYDWLEDNIITDWQQTS